VSKLGEPSKAMARHLDRIEVIKYCKNPEYYLEEAACEYLKSNPYEEEESYEVRLSRAYSSFEPVYTHLRNLVVGTALRRKIVVSGGDGPEWKKFFENTNLEGDDIQVFTRNIFSDAVDGGWAGILIDYPTIPPGLSKAEEKARYPNARPYFVPVLANTILDIRFKSNNDTMLDESDYGRQLSLLQITCIDKKPDPNDEFAEVERQAVKVWDYEGERVRYRYFIQKDKDPAQGNTNVEYEQEGEAIFLTSPIIPYIIIPGGAKEEDAIYRPLMLDTARLNMQHWVTSADLNNMINVTANPRFVISGVYDRMKGILAATSRALILTNDKAKADWKGAPMDGATIVRLRLQDLMQSMKTLAVVAMNPTGTVQPQSGVSKIIDKSQNDSLLNVLVTGLEAGINQALKIATKYMGDDNAPTITLSKNFIAAPLHSQQILALIEVYNAGLFDAKLLMEILEAGDLFEGLADFSVESILSRLNVGEDGRPVATALSAAAQGEPRSSLTQGEPRSSLARNQPLDAPTREPAQATGVPREADRA